MNANIEMLNKIESDFFSMEDYLIPVIKMDANYLENKKPIILFPTSDDVFVPNFEALTVHNNALSQLGDKFDIPGKYLSKLYNGDVWQQKLFSENMRDHFVYSDKNTEKLLLRSNKGVLKAVLSDKFDRYNSMGVLTTFLDEMSKAKFDLGNIYYDGITYFVEMNNKVNPIMINDEPHWISVQYRNSDFGQSALSINMMLVKEICSNGLVMNTLMRSIHKGKQMGTGPDFKLSDKTMKLESEYKKSIISDVIPQVLSEENITRIHSYFNILNEIEVPTENVIEKLPKLGASKSDLEKVKGILMDNKHETGVRDGGNVVRVANAVSWLANGISLEDGQNANKYKEMSGKLLSKYVKF